LGPKKFNKVDRFPTYLGHFWPNFFSLRFVLFASRCRSLKALGMMRKALKSLPFKVLESYLQRWLNHPN
jgi:hypothetical protein